jgi:hypothetical protein
MFMAIFPLHRISAVAELFDLLIAAVFFYMTTLLFGGVAAPLLRATSLPLCGRQRFNFKGKGTQHITLHIIVHEIAPLLTAQKPGFPQNLQMLRYRSLGKLQLSRQGSDALVMAQ